MLPQGAGMPDATQDDALQRLVVRRVQAAGLLRPTTAGAVWSLPCSRAERDRIAAQAIAAGELIELDVEGVRYWATPAALAVLDGVPGMSGFEARGAFSHRWTLMWDGRRRLALFGFDYVWEVYKPQAERRWGTTCCRYSGVSASSPASTPSASRAP
ncbi:hypothetical protein DSL92_03915 [Billgrantia gudaonensis]|uniref:Winged helix DNA-binding domain-containing protein n=1 Tax=Billgrantia gudaonensis TaxID=376427 RepID=A0A3S0R568_9GAMM|nr:hypothetical protein DSL92_03915 [Halomonas gudaonensis]